MNIKFENMVAIQQPVVALGSTRKRETTRVAIRIAIGVAKTIRAAITITI